jgi:hypothetical protein
MSSEEEDYKRDERHDDEREEVYDREEIDEDTLQLKFDTSGEKITSLFDGLVNKYLRQYLVDKFDKNKNDAVKDYKVDTRALGGLWDDHRMPIIMRKKIDIKVFSSRTTVDRIKTEASDIMDKWVDDIDDIKLTGNLANYLNIDYIKEQMKAKLTTILSETRARKTGWFGSNDAMFGRYKKTRKVGGNSQRKRSRKNITRRKK